MSSLSEFRSVELSNPVKIFSDPENEYTLVKPVTIPALMRTTATRHPNHTALMYQNEATKEWIGITYKQYRQKVEKMAKVLMKLGLERHGVVAVLAFNSVEWFVSELAAIHAG